MVNRVLFGDVGKLYGNIVGFILHGIVFVSLGKERAAFPFLEFFVSFENEIPAGAY